MVWARVHNPRLTRLEQIEELTGLLTKWQPGTAMYGTLAVQRWFPQMGLWKLVEYAELTDPPVPTPGNRYYMCADNYDAIVADAHGVQLLTDRHLARARDLSAWDITEIVPDRYLVKATDLEPWYADNAPDPQVVMKAREDFGDMILTPDTVPDYASARWGGPGHLPA